MLLAFAGITGRIPVWMAVSLSLVIILYAAAIVFVLQRVVLASGQDFYANKVDLRQLLEIAARALYAVVFSNGLALSYTIVIVFFGCCAKLAKRSLRDWMVSSGLIVAIFVFMAAVYFSQQVVYRGQLPSRMRYDFPAGLFVPFSYYVLICYIFYQMRAYLNSRITNYISIFFAFLICAYYAPKLAGKFNSRELTQAVSLNIQKTDRFFKEISSLTAFAKASPRSPIILEAHGLDAYEGLISIQIYARSLGVENPISVRLHSTDSSQGALYGRLEQQIRAWQSDGNSQFVPLSKSLSNTESGCISVGINGPASNGCAAFEVRT